VLGLAETGKFFLVAWASAWVCWVAVDGAAREIQPSLIWRAKSLGSSSWKWIFCVLLPSCRDGIRTGLRTSLSLGLIVIAVAELSGVYEKSSGYWWSEGLGYRLFRSLDEARDDLMMASILTFALLALLGDFIFFLIWNGVPAISFSLRQKRVAKFVTAARKMELEKDTNLQKSPVLKVAGLSAGYNGKTIIHELSFTIPAGATMSVVGPSGCGKTTLIRAIGHFMDEEFSVSGQVRAGTTRIDEPGPWVGVVLQDAPVFGHMTVWDNVTLVAAFLIFPLMRQSRQLGACYPSSDWNRLLAKRRKLYRAVNASVFLLQERCLKIHPS
jgi:ABC-type multidrug transport system fused ATPase/permease subunit